MKSFNHFLKTTEFSSKILQEAVCDLYAKLRPLNESVSTEVPQELVDALTRFYKADTNDPRNQDFYGGWLRDYADVALPVWNSTHDISEVAQALCDAEEDID